MSQRLAFSVTSAWGVYPPTDRLFPVVRQCYSDAVTKSELVTAVAERHDLLPSDAEVIVHEIFAALTEALRRGERIELRGFGMFTVKDRPAREGRNPRTGAVVSILAKRVPVFKVGKELRERVQ
jgi:integration host factor beta subunit